MATGIIIPTPKAQFFDNSGDPLNGGKLYTYVTGTSTPAAVYSDIGLTTPHANPVVLDSAGRATIYLDSAVTYKFVLKTSADVTVWTVDGVAVSAVTGIVTSIVAGSGVSISYTGATSGTGDVTVNSTSRRNACDGRLTLETGVAISVTDQADKTTLYFTPFRGNQISLYDGSSAWTLLTFAELSLDCSAYTASKPYDIFAYNNSGSVALESLVWTNATTRATALTTQNGILVKTGATTRRYLGTVYVDSGQKLQDTQAKRLVWNYYHRVPRTLRRHDGTNSWTYGEGAALAWRQANAAAANMVEVMVGVAERPVGLRIAVRYAAGATAAIGYLGFGEDSTSSPLTTDVISNGGTGIASDYGILTAEMQRITAVGYHYYAWLERTNNDAANSSYTFYGDNGEADGQIAGIIGSIDG